MPFENKNPYSLSQMKDIKNQREDTETESDTVQGMVPASARTPAFSGQRVPEGMQRA